MFERAIATFRADDPAALTSAEVATRRRSSRVVGPDSRRMSPPPPRELRSAMLAERQSA